MIAYGFFCAILGLALALLLQALDKINRSRPSTAGEEVSSKIHRKLKNTSLRIEFWCCCGNFSNGQVPDGDLERSEKDFEDALAAIRELQHARLVMCRPGQ